MGAMVSLVGSDVGEGDLEIGEQFYSAQPGPTLLKVGVIDELMGRFP